MTKQKYEVTGMTCSACSSHVEKSVSRLAGMAQVTVNLLTNSMQVVYDETLCKEEDIVNAVEKAGYGARCAKQNQNARGKGREEAGREALKGKKESRQMQIRLCVSLVFMAALMMVSMHHMFFMWLHIPVPGIFLMLFHGNENALTFAFTQFLLVLPIIYVNRKYYQKGLGTLFHGSPNMDSLIAVGSGAALLYGIFAIYRIGYGLGHGQEALVSRYSGDLYFESAGMILALITVGKYLEARSKGKTGEAIEKLMDLSPKTAIVLGKDGQEREVPTEQLLQDDLFVVKPGSLVPADGVVVEGYSSMDEAAITGESIPVEKHPGDPVVSATMNKAGRLVCRAVKVGEDTTLSQIIRLVEEASASKAPIAQLADKIAGIFVPAVMAIAAVTFVVWLLAGSSLEHAMSCAIAVLVISCPCALGLATPVAIMVGTGVGAKYGILIKSGDALQSARQIDTVVLDKTGTITEGKPQVTDLVVYENRERETVLALAAAIEKPSEHPLAEAVVSEAVQKGINIPQAEEFQAVFGRGVMGTCQGVRCLAGNKSFMEENGIMLSKDQQKEMERFSGQGKTPLLFAEDGKLSGLIAVADTVKPSSLQAIESFKEMKIDVVMLTGDNKQTARAVQDMLGIDRVVAEVLPQDKEKEIQRLKQEGRKVAMVGDGINDAPALASSDVGIAIGAGTDVAIESADIILMKNSLTEVVTAIRLSKAVIRNIKENLFWAFFYNVIGIPLAAGVLYPWFHIRLNPMFGAAAMSLSSLFVVSNALRLRSFKEDKREKGRAEEKREEKKEESKKENKENRKEEKEIIKEKGKVEKKMNKTIKIEGMMCNHCTGTVQKALEAVPGVESVSMSLADKCAKVVCGEAVENDALKAAVTEAGYEVTEIR